MIRSSETDIHPLIFGTYIRLCDIFKMSVASSNISWTNNFSTVTSSTVSSISAPAFSGDELLLLTVVLLLISLIGISQNIIVAAAIFLSRNRLLDIPSTWLLLSLTVGDLLVCSVSVPLHIVHLHKFYWEPMLMFAQLTTLVSSGSLVMLTFNRFISIFNTFSYMRRMTVRRAQMFALSVWIISLLLTICGTTGRIKKIQPLLYPAMGYYAVINVLTAGFHIYMFQKAWFKMRAIKKQCSNIMSGQQKTVIKEFHHFFRLFLVVGIYFVTWVPFIITLTLPQNDRERRMRWFQRRFTLCYTFLSINSVIHPIIYFLRGEEFKRFTRKLRPLVLPRSTNCERNRNVFYIHSLR